MENDEEILRLKDRINFLERELEKFKQRCQKLKQSYDIQYNELNENVKYAKFIQTAFLPTEEEIKLSFPESFLMYLPKNEIGGDFYFHYHSPNNEYILFSVGDATGHGIPGALLSMLGLSMLNEIVRYQLTNNPALMLELLRLNMKFIFRRLTTSFRPNSLDELFETYLFDILTFIVESVKMFFEKINPLKFKWKNLNDLFSFSYYMRELLDRKLEYQVERQSALYEIVEFDIENNFSFDMSMVLFYPKKNKLYFSGANSSIIIVRDGQMFELKGIRNPIGFYYEEKKFEKQEFDLKSGDVIYMFTDGYKDQIGGNNQKLSSRRFKELLLDIYELPMEAQLEAFQTHFRFWKADFEQTDDVTLVGIRWQDIF